MVTALLSMVSPTMRLEEVSQMLSLKSYRATKKWLDENNIKPRKRRYDRLAVIAAQYR